MMSMNPRNIVKLLKIAFEEPRYDIETVISENERKFSLHLENLIKEAIDDALIVEVYEELEFGEANALPPSLSMEVDDEDLGSEIQMEANEDSLSVEGDDIPLEYKERATKFWKSGKRKLKFETVKNRFKRLKHREQLYRWEEQVLKNGTRSEKLNQISTYVLDKFKEALDKRLTVHDLDIRRWALEAREKLSLSTDLFTASEKWLHTFKATYGIVSRKVNKFVTQKSVNEKDKTENEARKFVDKVKIALSNVGEANVFNSDQSGFNLEMHTGRTLAFKGQHKVESLTQSKNAMTHSYTIQPLISASGVLLSPLLLVLQEKGGEFGPHVKQKMFKAENILAVASNSGKMTSELTRMWFQEVFLTQSNHNSVLLLDSWGGHNSATFDKVSHGRENCTILTIPAGTTGTVQPLDVFFFRPWKNYIRHFSDKVILHNYDCSLHQRDNIIKLQSLIHNQFSSPRFQNLVKYAWYKSGYLEERPPEFENPVDFCFVKCASECDVCSTVGIIKCAWCTKSLCFTHFIYNITTASSISNRIT